MILHVHADILERWINMTEEEKVEDGGSIQALGFTEQLQSLNTGLRELSEKLNALNTGGKRSVHEDTHGEKVKQEKSDGNKHRNETFSPHQGQGMQYTGSMQQHADHNSKTVHNSEEGKKETAAMASLLKKILVDSAVVPPAVTSRILERYGTSLSEMLGSGMIKEIQKKMEAHESSDQGSDKNSSDKHQSNNQTAVVETHKQKHEQTEGSSKAQTNANMQPKNPGSAVSKESDGSSASKKTANAVAEKRRPARAPPARKSGSSNQKRMTSADQKDLARGFSVDTVPRNSFLKEQNEVKQRSAKRKSSSTVSGSRSKKKEDANGSIKGEEEEFEASLEDDLQAVERSGNIENFDHNGAPRFRYNPELLADLSCDSDPSELSEVQRVAEDCWRARWLTSSEKDAQVNEDGNPVHYAAFNLPVVYEAGRTGFQDTKDFCPPLGSVVAGRYRVSKFLGSAAFSIALACKDLLNDCKVCLKIVKNNKDFFDQSIDEIKVLRFLNRMGDPDENYIVRLNEHFYYKEHLFICTELLQENLFDAQQYIEKHKAPKYFTLGRLQKICWQLLRALDFIHKKGLIHTDLKPENVLVKSYSRCDVKLIDFGSSCFVSDRLSSYIQSRSYRAPEVTLGLPYGPKIDIWSLGCVLAELFTGDVLFANEAIQFALVRMQSWLDGFPHWMLNEAPFRHKFFTAKGDVFLDDSKRDRTMILKPAWLPLDKKLGCSDSKFVDFLKYLLQVDVTRRPTAEEAMQHPWLHEVYNGEEYKF